MNWNKKFRQIVKKLWKVSKIILLVLSILILLFISTIVGAKIINGNNSTIKSVNGIQESSYIELNGIKQYVQIRGQDKNNPIILFVHGGPANPLAYLTYYYQQEIEKKYTVVHWDQRGSGRTFYENPEQTNLSSDQIVADMDALVDYLLDRFSVENVIVIGHSWGTIVGSKYVRLYPQKVTAYIEVSKVVNTFEGVKMSGELAKQKAIEQQNQKDIETFNTLIAELSTINGYKPTVFKYYVNLRTLTFKYLPYQGKRSAFITLWTGVSSPDFSIRDLKWFFKSTAIYDFERLETNLIKECFFFNAYEYPLSYEIPVFFVSGKYDSTTPVKLAKKYYNDISAPQKDFVIIKNAGHSPYLDNSADFCNTVMQVLNLVEMKK